MDEEKKKYLEDNMGMQHVNAWLDRKGNMISGKTKIHSHYDASKGYKIFGQHKFVKIFERFSIEDAADNIKEEAQLIRLVRRTNTGFMIMRNIGSKALPARRQDIAKIIEVNEETARRLIKKWQAKDIIYVHVVEGKKDKHGKRIEHFYINPMYGMKSVFIPPQVYIFFRDVLQTVLTDFDIRELDKITGVESGEIEISNEEQDLHKDIAASQEDADRAKMFIETTCALDYKRNVIYLRPIMNSDIAVIKYVCMGSMHGGLAPEEFEDALDGLICME
jgi:hypothetical protein